MDEQQRLSNAYSDLKDKYVALKRKVGDLAAKLGEAERENSRLWVKLKQQHEQLEYHPLPVTSYLVQSDEKL
jgi:hypothetical protein